MPDSLPSQQSGRCPCCGSRPDARRPECASAEAERLRAALSGLSDRVLNLGGFMHKRPCAEAEFYVKRADVLAQIAVTVALTTGTETRP